MEKSRLEDLYFKQVVSKFDHVLHAFSYGSGVFNQSTNNAEGLKEQEEKMVDFIFVIPDNPAKWHKENFERQEKGHYSPGASFLLGPADKIGRRQEDGTGWGSRRLEWIHKLGAEIYYNTDVPFLGRRIKYGAITVSDLCRDLEEWTTLYVAGRMQKPVLTIRSNERIEKSSLINLNHALRASLLTLPEEFEDKDLFTAITGISYAGDLRMKYAENPKKIQNIVNGSYREFQQLYAPLLENNFKNILKYDRKTNKIQQDYSNQVRLKMMQELPSNLQRRLEKDFGSGHTTRDQIYSSLIEKRIEGKSIQFSTAKIVNSTSFNQTIKGIFTAGAKKSFVYTMAKVMKAMK